MVWGAAECRGNCQGISHFLESGHPGVMDSEPLSVLSSSFALFMLWFFRLES